MDWNAVRETLLDSTAALFKGRERILIVDDDDSLRQFAVSALSREGYEIHQGSNGEEGVEQYDKLRPRLVLMGARCDHAAARFQRNGSGRYRAEAK